ncbi:LIC_13387 family protein [Dyadobacter psychrophilus]|uniref:Uncharacterized protein n=1 Tax=Dyadobacter psychrophilus TaxID=651661 RepID=A0A1T5E126_9BACT|nr:hypothetical protein [Dyadobacter psychrophilus]SKB77655.1 hypothetical protein SAMN05660293_02079 [Dyadobacter psychrophilus]
MMSSKILLRIAAALIVVHLLGHSVGHSTWDEPEDPKMGAVVKVMKSYSANFMGASKTMAEYYHGYSLMIFGLFIMTILLLWSISGFVNEQKNIANKLLLPIGIIYILFGVVEFRYFFPFAAGISLCAGLCTLLAVIVNKK